jgi:hypothetical protein
MDFFCKIFFVLSKIITSTSYLTLAENPYLFSKIFCPFPKITISSTCPLLLSEQQMLEQQMPLRHVRTANAIRA